MCDFDNGFILCKCDDPKIKVHNRKSKRQKKKNKKLKHVEYSWTLHKYIGLTAENEIGRYMHPVTDIGKGLTAEFIFNEINNRNCFDFEYSPREGDNLLIANTKTMDRIEFIYRDGIWEEGHYSPFDHVSKEVQNGQVLPPNH